MNFVSTIHFLVSATQLALGMCMVFKTRGNRSQGWDVVAAMHREQSVGFINRPHAENWMELYNQTIDKGWFAGCGVSTWFCCHAAGVGSILWNVINAMEFAVYQGSGFVWKQHGLLPHVLTEHLALEMPTPRCTERGKWDGLEQAGVWTRALKDVDHDYAAGLRRFLVRRVWVPTEQLTARVDSELALLGPDFVKGAYLGVHIRRTDKIKEAPYVDTAAYVGAIYAVRVWFPGVHHVYVASDDPSVFPDIQAALGHEMVVKQAPHVPRKFFGEQDYEDADFLYATMRDMEVLRRSRCFIGTGSSNMGSIVHFARDAHLAALDVSLDDDWLAEILR